MPAAGDASRSSALHGQGTWPRRHIQDASGRNGISGWGQCALGGGQQRGGWRTSRWQHGPIISSFDGETLEAGLYNVHVPSWDYPAGSRELHGTLPGALLLFRVSGLLSGR